MRTQLSTSQIAKLVRANLKDALPEWKFSVRTKSYSGGSSIYLSLMAGPVEVIEGVLDYQSGDIFPDEDGYAQLNQYSLLYPKIHNQGERMSNGTKLTPKGWKVMSMAAEILEAYHWDESDAQTDYFCCNFYVHLEIGKWDVAYEVRGEK